MSEEQPIERKRGKLSLAEMATIKELAGKVSIDEIARRINRTEEPVVRYMKEQDIYTAAKTNKSQQFKDIRDKLYKEKFWEQIVAQLEESELNFFIDSWVRYVQQFSSDVLATEELQIKDLVMLDIFQSRIMTSFKEYSKEISRLQGLIDDELSLPRDDRDKDVLANYHEAISAMQVSMQRSNKDILEYQDKKDKILAGMNATRQARVKNLQNMKIDFAGLMKELEEEDKKERAGVEMELRRLASIKATKDLANYHVYGDGILDKPLLNCDTVGDEDE